jgi:hypothetical protein
MGKMVGAGAGAGVGAGAEVFLQATEEPEP